MPSFHFLLLLLLSSLLVVCRFRCLYMNNLVNIKKNKNQEEFFEIFFFVDLERWLLLLRAVDFLTKIYVRCWKDE